MRVRIGHGGASGRGPLRPLVRARSSALTHWGGGGQVWRQDPIPVFCFIRDASKTDVTVSLSAPSQPLPPLSLPLSCHGARAGGGAQRAAVGPCEPAAAAAAAAWRRPRRIRDRSKIAPRVRGAR